MDTQEEIIDFGNFKVGTTQDWKFGLITRSVYRNSTNRFSIDETVGAWVTAVVDLKTMEKLTKGEMSLMELVWK